jgi:hypothetical protein
MVGTILIYTDFWFGPPTILAGAKRGLESGGIVRFKSDWKVSVSFPQMHGGMARMVLL